ncbi:hypothetical protein IGS67_06665 [Flavimobilis sp. GY10621]|uniref:Ig-like domain-containing protein n=1 Tax=Flavimobilis rhizosphaerae TaxID=2775421 RepID=A0ABR9DPX9_9MICO|nr:hypothetical protein [Flavimobilis rhizosphaerae]MBD9699173.1 hypothetical protein [Flavimobilis rhizosphaerae]
MLHKILAGALGLALAVGGVGAPAFAAEVKPTVTVAAAKISAPKVSVAGKAIVGQKLRVKSAPWKPRGTKLTYRWLQNGKPIPGATRSTLTLKPKQVGKRISVKVTARKAGAKTVTRTSARTVAVKRASFKASTPRLLGSATVGERLTVATGQWSPAATTLTYRWTRDGTTIAGATGPSYTLCPADLGHRIRATVTGARSGYTTTSRTTSPSAVVASFYDASFGTFPTTTYTGYGDDIITLDSSRKAVVVTAQHSGSSNFVVRARTADFGYGDLLVNEIGRYSGTTATGLSPYDDETGILEIDADGAWTITVAPVSSLPALPTSGVGDAVFLYDGAAVTKGVAHYGRSNFIVKQYHRDERFGGRLTWETHVNEIGRYSGNRYFRSGPSVVTIEADGAWEIL